MCGDLLDENGNRNAILPPHISPDAKVGAKRADGGDEVRLPDLQSFLLHHLLHSFDDSIIAVVNLYKTPNDGKHLLLSDGVNVKCQPARESAQEGRADPVVLELREDAEDIQDVSSL